jgi:hypothetical protein
MVRLGRSSQEVTTAATGTGASRRVLLLKGGFQRAHAKLHDARARAFAVGGGRALSGGAVVGAVGVATLVVGTEDGGSVRTLKGKNDKKKEQRHQRTQSYLDLELNKKVRFGKLSR